MSRKIQGSISSAANLQPRRAKRLCIILKEATEKNLLPIFLFSWPQSTVWKCEECYTMDAWYVRRYSRVKVCLCLYVCISGVRQNLGLCDESVSVASKVLLAACRLLIHIRRGWLESVADDTERYWETEGERKKRERKRLDKWTNTMCRLIPRCHLLAKQNISSLTSTATPWLLFYVAPKLQSVYCGMKEPTLHKKYFSSTSRSVELLGACLSKISGSSYLSWRHFDLWAIVSSLKY